MPSNHDILNDLADRLASRPLIDGGRFGEENLSLWNWTVRNAAPIDVPAHPPSDSDVIIVGAGLTGLWAAYYLKTLNPALSVQIFEARHVAFGASGRAGGWAIASLDGQQSYIENLPSEERTRAVRVVTDTLDEIERILSKENIACGYKRGGMIRVAARNRRQTIMLKKYHASIVVENGSTAPGELLDEDRARSLTSMVGITGAVTFPHCAVLNPAQLALGLAKRLTQMGVSIFERCEVLSVQNGAVRLAEGTIHADIIVPVVEGYSATIPDLRDRIIPVYSHVIATDPLRPTLRASLGLDDRQAFSDCSRISTYGQITEDDRLVFGALASYPASGKLGTLSKAHLRSQYRMIYNTLLELWPQIASAKISHAWSGALGVPKSFRPAIVEDRSRKLVWGGGYVGRGLSNSNLFGRTIAELITQQTSERTQCPWVYRNVELPSVIGRWIPDPLRGIGIAAATMPGRLSEQAMQQDWLPDAAKTAVDFVSHLVEIKK